MDDSYREEIRRLARAHIDPDPQPSEDLIQKIRAIFTERS